MRFHKHYHFYQIYFDLIHNGWNTSWLVFQILTYIWVYSILLLLAQAMQVIRQFYYFIQHINFFNCQNLFGSFLCCWVFLIEFFNSKLLLPLFIQKLWKTMCKEKPTLSIIDCQIKLYTIQIIFCFGKFLSSILNQTSNFGH